MALRAPASPERVGVHCPSQLSSAQLTDTLCADITRSLETCTGDAFQRWRMEKDVRAKILDLALSASQAGGASAERAARVIVEVLHQSERRSQSALKAACLSALWDLGRSHPAAISSDVLARLDFHQLLEEVLPKGPQAGAEAILRLLRAFAFSKLSREAKLKLCDVGLASKVASVACQCHTSPIFGGLLAWFMGACSESSFSCAAYFGGRLLKHLEATLVQYGPRESRDVVLDLLLAVHKVSSRGCCSLAQPQAVLEVCVTICLRFNDESEVLGASCLLLQKATSKFWRFVDPFAPASMQLMMDSFPFVVKALQGRVNDPKDTEVVVACAEFLLSVFTFVPGADASRRVALRQTIEAAPVAEAIAHGLSLICDVERPVHAWLLLTAMGKVCLLAAGSKQPQRFRLAGGIKLIVECLRLYKLRAPVGLYSVGDNPLTVGFWALDLILRSGGPQLIESGIRDFARADGVRLLMRHIDNPLVAAVVPTVLTALRTFDVRPEMREVAWKRHRPLIYDRELSRAASRRGEEWRHPHRVPKEDYHEDEAVVEEGFWDDDAPVVAGAAMTTAVTTMMVAAATMPPTDGDSDSDDNDREDEAGVEESFWDDDAPVVAGAATTTAVATTVATTAAAMPPADGDSDSDDNDREDEALVEESFWDDDAPVVAGAATTTTVATTVATTAAAMPPADGDGDSDDKDHEDEALVEEGFWDDDDAAVVVAGAAMTAAVTAAESETLINNRATPVNIIVEVAVIIAAPAMVAVAVEALIAFAAAYLAS
jgi:hypothetical protein